MKGTLTIGLCCLFTACAPGPRGFPAVQGIANFDQVSRHLYRGAQPNRLGIRYLKGLGIGTIINLRAGDEWQAEESEAMRQDMAYHHIPMDGYRRPSRETVLAVLARIEQSEAPVFVHCQFGCDRTGTIIAAYRMQREGWSSSKALNEAEVFGMSRWEVWMKQFIKGFKQ